METSYELIIYVRDLLFSSKIVATARAHGVPFRVVRDVNKLMETSGKRLIIDLNVEGAIQVGSEWKARFGGLVTGFVSHVAVETITSARNAGIDQVLSNGGFTARLDELVSGK